MLKSQSNTAQVLFLRGEIIGNRVQIPDDRVTVMDSSLHYAIAQEARRRSAA